MSSHVYPKLSAVEISVLIAALPLVAGAIISFIVTSTWYQWKDGYYRTGCIKRNAMASFGTMINFLKPRQLRALISRTTGEAIEHYCTVWHVPHQPVLVETGGRFPAATLHFLDCKLRQKGPILLYFHGGGFVVPLQSPAFAMSLARTARASPVILEYTLAPECVYPGQLAQAIAALRLILQYRKPSEIIIGGESAGGNMVLAVMAHLQQPKPGIPPLVLPAEQQQIPGRFRAVFAISPRTANLGTAESFTYNSGKDFMSKCSLSVITHIWKPEADVWAAPVLARDGFWDNLKADKVLLMVGGNEVYRDDICHVAKVMGANEVSVVDLEQNGEAEKGNGPAMQFMICPGEFHCQASLDVSLRIADGYMAKGIIGWLARL